MLLDVNNSFLRTKVVVAVELGFANSGRDIFFLKGVWFQKLLLMLLLQLLLLLLKLRLLLLLP